MMPTVRQAQSPRDNEQAAKLVFSEYQKEGYIDSNVTEENFRLSNFAALPSAIRFIAEVRDDIIGTVTVIKDSNHGLPMDDLYKKELDEIRTSGIHIAEVSQLAAKRGEGKNSLFIFVPLFRAVVQFAHSHAIDAFVIAVNPKHLEFYKKLSFQEIGPLKYYASVNQAPAHALMLDLRSTKGKNELLERLWH